VSSDRAVLDPPDAGPAPAAQKRKNMVGSIWLWPALVFAPTLFLTQMSLNYSLVEWACSSQKHGSLHIIPAVSLVIVLVTIALAVRDWQHSRRLAEKDGGDPASRSAFLALTGVAVASMSALAIVLQWATQFAINPCL
jgi:uncharacterized membrane protein (DUF4010 family)